MIELRYFTGTGNSLHLLQICTEVFKAQGQEVHLASILQPNNWSQPPALLGLSFPVYSFGVPRIMKKYLAQLPVFPKPVKTFILAAMGGRDEEGWTLQECQKLLAGKNCEIVWADAVITPDNWMPMAYVPNASEAELLLRQGEDHVRQVARKLLAGNETFCKPFVMPKFGPIGSRIMHYMFHHRGIYKLWDFFKTTPACNGCGICAKQCPMQAIQMENKKPRWSAACEQCMRCMNFCPCKAIRQLEWIGHGSRRNQYHEPHFKPALE